MSIHFLAFEEVLWDSTLRIFARRTAEDLLEGLKLDRHSFNARIISGGAAGATCLALRIELHLEESHQAKFAIQLVHP